MSTLTIAAAHGADDGTTQTLTQVQLGADGRREIFVKADARLIIDDIVIGPQRDTTLAIYGAGGSGAGAVDVSVKSIRSEHGPGAYNPHLAIQLRNVTIGTLNVQGGNERDTRISIGFDNASSASRILLHNMATHTLDLNVRQGPTSNRGPSPATAPPPSTAAESRTSGMPPSSGIPGEVRLRDITFKSLALNGHNDKGGATPVSLDINAVALSGPAENPKVRLANLQILDGKLKFQPKATYLQATSLADRCQDIGGRISIELQNSSVGEKEGPTEFLPAALPGSLNVYIARNLCSEITATNFQVYGDIDIVSEDVIGLLRLDRLTSDAQRANDFGLRAEALLQIMVRSASLSNVEMSMSHQVEVDPGLGRRAQRT